MATPKIVSVSSTLNVRTSPSTTSTIVGSLNNGQVVFVLSETNGWAMILFNNKNAYVSSAYLNSGSQKQVSVNSTLNLRSGPSTSSTIIASLPNGAIVTVFSQANGWSFLVYNDKQGYASSMYLMDVSPTPPPTPSPNNIVTFAKKYVGSPYVFGAAGPTSFDCSGFIYYVFKSNKYAITRTNVAGYWKSVTRLSNPQPGDLIFFQNTYQPGPSHMGICIGNGQFIHAADETYGVIISNISNSYYTSHFLGYGRF